MIQLKTILKCIDNSGALSVECIKVIRAGNWARVGDEVTVVVQRAKPLAQQRLSEKLKQGDIRRAIIVRTKSPSTRENGQTVRFDDNACVLINDKKDPVGSRITSKKNAFITNK